MLNLNNGVPGASMNHSMEEEEVEQEETEHEAEKEEPSDEWRK